MDISLVLHCLNWISKVGEALSYWVIFLALYGSSSSKILKNTLIFSDILFLFSSNRSILIGLLLCNCSVLLCGLTLMILNYMVFLTDHTIESLPNPNSFSNKLTHSNTVDSPYLKAGNHFRLYDGKAAEVKHSIKFTCPCSKHPIKFQFIL